MKYSFSKVYLVILILWIPFYFFWGWIRYKFVGDASAALGYAIESFYIGLLSLLTASVVLMVKNKFVDLWDYVVFLISIVVLLVTRAPQFIIELF